MAVLHTVNKAPFENRTLEACLAHALDGCTVLLLEDGVYGAMSGTAAEASVREALGRLGVCALGPDLAARGLDPDRIIDGIRVVGYGGFVDLAAEHHSVNAWL